MSEYEDWEDRVGPAQHDPDPPMPYEYPWIKAWGKLCKFSADEVRRQIALARVESAPETATWKEAEMARFSTLTDITRIETRLWLVDYAEAYGLMIPSSVFRRWLDPLWEPPSLLMPAPWYNPE